jgi:SPX domain protein involved in polyphosphate accumulation
MQNVFRRYEKKYLVTMEQGAVLQKLVRRYAEIDRQGEYLIQDLYYDTADWDIIRKAIEKPLYKEKLRLRSYGLYNSESPVFLELKKKFEGIVYKRRVAFPLGELKNRGVSEIVSALDSQIAREISYFLQTNQVSEKIHIAYKRIAYTGIEDKGLRITFDKNIAFHLCSLNNINFGEYSHKDYNDRQIKGRQILDDNQVLMEIKTTGAIPLWLIRTLSENNIFPISFSKVGVCYVRHISKWQGVKEVKNAA